MFPQIEIRQDVKQELAYSQSYTQLQQLMSDDITSLNTLMQLWLDQKQENTQFTSQICVCLKVCGRSGLVKLMKCNELKWMVHLLLHKEFGWCVKCDLPDVVLQSFFLSTNGKHWWTFLLTILHNLFSSKHLLVLSRLTYTALVLSEMMTYFHDSDRHGTFGLQCLLEVSQRD